MNSTDTMTMTGEGYGYVHFKRGIEKKKKHKGNGVMDTLVCMLRGSSCMATKLADAIEKCEEKQEEVNDKKENV